MRVFGVLCSILLAGGAFAQSPVISNVLNAGIGDNNFAPLSLIYVYGTFPADSVHNFGVTVGGVAGYVESVNSTGYITAIIPSGAPLGTQPVVVTWKTNVSNAFPINLNAYAPEFITTTVVAVAASGPQFPLTSYFPIAHQNMTPVSNAAPAKPGETLVSLLSGLGQTSPPIRPGGLNTFSTLAVTPVVTVGGMNAQLTKYGSSGSNDEVDFVVPAAAPSGSLPVVLSIAGVSSNTVTIPVGAQPLVTAVLNGASFRSPGTVVPGSMISIFGSGFGPADNLSAFPSTSVNNVSVLFDNQPAPIFALAAAEGQINVLVPCELASTGTTRLTVSGLGGPSAAVTLNLAAAVPGLFFYTDPSLTTRRNAVAVLANTAWVAMPVSMATAMKIPHDCSTVPAISTCGQPVHPGDNLQIYLTGLGKATPGGDPKGTTLTTGSTAPADGNPLYQTVSAPTVTIGGVAAPVAFSGIAPGFTGLYQINVQIPANVAPGDDVPLTVTMPGNATDSATIAIAAQ